MTLDAETHAATLRRVTTLTCILALGVIGLGAWVRIVGAGLACPDWPGCFGRLIAPSAPEHVAAAQAAFPDVTVDVSGARIEMTHRYAAGALGLLVTAIFILSWRMRRSDVRPLLLATALLSLVVAQALLGMVTIFMQLHPGIVTLHLIGGMSALALLVWLALRHRAGWPAAHVRPRMRRDRAIAVAGVSVLMLQIALGGWSSTHGVIHWAHQAGAVATALILAAMFLLTFRRAPTRPLAWAMIVVLAAQVGLGIANLQLGTPPLLALLHNVAAALLLVSVVTITFRVCVAPAEPAP